MGGGTGSWSIQGLESLQIQSMTYIIHVAEYAGRLSTDGVRRSNPAASFRFLPLPPEHER